MGCDVCYTNHAAADQNSADNLLVLLAAAGCNYFMGVPCSDDVMLNYQSTSYHDALAAEGSSICGLHRILDMAQKKGIFRDSEPALLEPSTRRELMRGLESSLRRNYLNAGGGDRFLLPPISPNPSDSSGTHACASVSRSRGRRLSHRTQIDLREAHAAARDAVRVELDIEAAFGSAFIERWEIVRSLHRSEFQGRICSSAGPGPTFE